MTGNEAGRNDAGSNDEADRREREDAEWRSIVDNYGDRPDVPLPPEQPPDPDEHPWPSLRSGPLHQEPAELAPRSWEPEPEDERYVPPPPPPVPRPQGLRLLAWLGLFGVPTVALVFAALHLRLPSPLGPFVGFLALVWFVGGFGYLVATMNGPKDSDGDWDDGAVV